MTNFDLFPRDVKNVINTTNREGRGLVVYGEHDGDIYDHISNMHPNVKQLISTNGFLNLDVLEAIRQRRDVRPIGVINKRKVPNYLMGFMKTCFSRMNVAQIEVSNRRTGDGCDYRVIKY